MLNQPLKSNESDGYIENQQNTPMIGKVHPKDDAVCSLCNGRGYTVRTNLDGNQFAYDCKCQKDTDHDTKVRRAGMEQLSRLYSFSNYIVRTEKQKAILILAKNYLSNSAYSWFFIGGQVGSGKTHLTVSIGVELIRKGKDVCYKNWLELVSELKRSEYEDKTYFENLVKYASSVPVLIIDDFLKTENAKTPTSKDLIYAYRIINARYSNMSLKTVVNSEYTINELMSIDEGIGSRIHERSKGFGINITDQGMNHRINND
jgi:DNA replication protein DnaC